MRIFFLVIMILSSAQVVAQGPDCTLHKDSLTRESVVLMPEKRADVVGGLPALGKAIRSKLKLPTSARPQPVDFSGVYVAFVIDEKGEVKGERVVRSTLPEISSQVFEAVKSLSWKPATCKGKPVPSLFILPVRICIEL